MKKDKLPLAVFTPSIGKRSETFVHKHVNELLPGKTLAVSCLNTTGDWSTNNTTHNLCPPQKQNLLNATKSRIYHYAGHNPQKNALKRVLKTHGVEVIMSEFLDWSAQWIDVANELGIRYFAHAHGTDINVRIREEKWRKEYLRYNKTGGIITISEFSKNQLIDIGILPEKIFVVPCSVDTQPTAKKHSNKEKIVCLNVGRMIACKSPIFAIDAFRRAAEKNHALHFNYVGAGPYLQAAQQLTQALDITNKVNLTGGLPHAQVMQAFADADIYIQHSVEDTENGMAEGLPVSILEAMSFGLPVVATRLTGIPEAVEDGITGFLVAPGDTQTMAEKILLLAANPELRNQMGQAAKKRAERYFSWNLEREKLLQILGLV